MTFAINRSVDADDTELYKELAKRYKEFGVTGAARVPFSWWLLSRRAGRVSRFGLAPIFEGRSGSYFPWLIECSSVRLSVKKLTG